MDKPLEGRAVGGAFGLNNGGNTRCRLFKRRLYSGLRNPTVLDIVDDSRMEDQQRLQDSVVKQCLQCTTDGCTSPGCRCSEVNRVHLNVLVGSRGIDVADGCVCLGVEHRQSSSEVIP